MGLDDLDGRGSTARHGRRPDAVDRRRHPAVPGHRHRLQAAHHHDARRSPTASGSSPRICIPGRFRYVEELQRLGADVRTSGHHAVVRGVPRSVRCAGACPRHPRRCGHGGRRARRRGRDAHLGRAPHRPWLRRPRRTPRRRRCRDRTCLNPLTEVVASVHRHATLDARSSFARTRLGQTASVPCSPVRTRSRLVTVDPPDLAVADLAGLGGVGDDLRRSGRRCPTARSPRA